MQPYSSNLPAAPRTSDELRISVRKGLTPVTTIDLLGQRLRIGRAANSEILLDHPSVSRHHADLVRTELGWEIVDCGSTNGMVVNGQRQRAARLQGGDLIEIRPFSLLVEGGGSRVQAGLSLADSSAITHFSPRSETPQVLIRQRLDELYSLARLVIRRKDGAALWPSLQSALRRALHAERLVLIGLDQRRSYFPLSGEGERRAEALGVSRSVLQSVVDSRNGVLVEQVDSHAQFAEAMSLAGGVVGSVLCVPVVINEEVRAIVYADRHRTMAPFRTEDLHFVAAAMDMAAAAVELDELQEKARTLAHVHGRIAAAREIQEMLLPSPVPQPSWGEIAAANVPADGMSGDIYDVAFDVDGRLVVMLADVAGKGVPAAFVTAALQNTLRMCLTESFDVLTAMRRMNSALYRHEDAGLFATLVLMHWSTDGAQVDVANAGHHAPLWLDHRGGVSAFPQRVGLPLGLGPEWTGDITAVAAREYRAVFTCTDGVTEARCGDREFGDEGAREAFQTSAAAATADDAVRQIVDRVRNFCRPQEPADDLTLLVVRRTG